MLEAQNEELREKLALTQEGWDIWTDAMMPGWHECNKYHSASNGQSLLIAEYCNDLFRVGEIYKHTYNTADTFEVKLSHMVCDESPHIFGTYNEAKKYLEMRVEEYIVNHRKKKNQQ
jgi:hypothetical protein